MPSSPRFTILVFLTTLWSAMSLNSRARFGNRYPLCPKDAVTTPNATYISNLDRLLSSLLLSTAQNNGFNRATVNGVYGLYLCHGNTTKDVCGDCVATAATDIRTLCPNSTQAVIWYDECHLRYSNASFFGAVEENLTTWMWNTQENTQPDEPDIDARALMYQLAAKVPSSPLMYETEELNETEVRYSMAQCSRDLNVANCSSCLRHLTTLMERCCERSAGWRILNPSCFIRHESYPFYTIPRPNTTDPVRRPSNQGNYTCFNLH